MSLCVNRALNLRVYVCVRNLFVCKRVSPTEWTRNIHMLGRTWSNQTRQNACFLYIKKDHIKYESPFKQRCTCIVVGETPTNPSKCLMYLSIKFRFLCNQCYIMSSTDHLKCLSMFIGKGGRGKKKAKKINVVCNLHIKWNYWIYFNSINDDDGNVF